ncbi:MAG TPA: EAL domain-containing protein [Allosphingosinicella sp.]|jgi:EAL domain-containing protein (putative c-di-GMP-specific phosphodiesterase class I)/CHASE2 domain-containing sensor protein
MGRLSQIWGSIRERRRANKGSRARILLWCTLASLIFGVIEFGQPLDDLLRTIRNKPRQHAASGDIVVVGIDDRSFSRLQKWPWPRRYYGELAQKLDQLGARSIYFDLDFSSPSDAKNDAAFARALAKVGRKVTLATRFVADPVTGARTDNFPIASFREHTKLAHINVWYSPLGAVWNLTYALDYGGKTYPSFASAIARTPGRSGDEFYIDYATDLRTIPAISFADVIQGKVRPEQIAGKDIVIGPAAEELGDLYVFPGYGRMPGVYLHALGAETLKQGRPVSLGWFVPFLLAFLTCAVAASLRSIRAIAAVFVLGVGMFLLVPMLLEANLIFVDVLPALVMQVAMWISLAWVNFQKSYRERGILNSVSGLPNLNALRQEKFNAEQVLIAARIQNYAEVSSAMPPEEEKALVAQIAARLTLGAAGHKLFHGDEGIFAWFADQGMARSIGEHLDALHALFRSPVMIGDNPIDLTVTFGFDSGSNRSLSNRLGSALVATDEAAAEGLRWKEYDPAKLKDATWRLSLLTQLDAAIEAGDLWIAYQPKLDLVRQELVGAEALARWSHPEKGPISPIEFILAAEQSDRIEKLTTFVLDRAIGAAAIVNGKGIDFQVSVNLSARLIDHPDLASTVTELLAKHRLQPNRLSLEITETAALSTHGMSLEALLELRYLGVDISIDDYGTGLSTLDYLKKIPATEIKIDKSFVQAIEKSHSDRLLVHSTIQLAHSLGQKVVAEGVEDIETLKTLERMGCDLAQGYLIGRPMNFRALLKQLSGEGSKQTASRG